MKTKLIRSGKTAALFLAWSLVFALVYAQKPLFTSNENHYFLKGLAEAGYGFLSADWHATTLDPTPVFSWLIKVTYQVFHSMFPVYIYYALLMGVYLYSITGIMGEIFNTGATKVKRYLFFAIVLLLHSAALRVVMSLILGPDWTYFFEGGVAGQRLLGEAFQPSVFAVFLLLSILMFLRKRYFLAAALLPLVATIHPTYLLTAALLTIAYASILLIETREIKTPLLVGLTALVLVLPILIHSMEVFLPTNAELYARTRYEMVYFRIPHHAVAAQWFNFSVVAAFIMVLVGTALVRKSRLFWIMLVLLVFAVSLSIVQVVTGSTSLALIFPWRMSILLVPLASCALAAAGLDSIWKQYDRWLENHQRLTTLAAGLLVLLLVIAGSVDFYREWRAKQTTPEVKVFNFVRDHAEASQVYVIPVSMQDFRLATGVPAVADFKSIPYQDRDFGEWLGRIHRVSYIYRQPTTGNTCQRLDYIAAHFGATHIVLPQSAFGLSCSWLDEIYNDGEFAVREFLPDRP